jgi:hypothetical protein
MSQLLPSSNDNEKSLFYIKAQAVGKLKEKRTVSKASLPEFKPSSVK